MLKTYREIFERAIDRALTIKGVDALKKTSLFWSNNCPDYKKKDKPK